ncbi:AAA family ATPase [Leeia sp. TBRC 13508]|uniref:AAA family ATPase n=1 Tax=Leeia speluncae TaxID=2884804 RepID=A0ABS8D6D2_9NEIS|nr:AAA family ATPase [Leeia speluncae]MCB6183702.1 AAA family ATPase [Leeia speluncae]
MDSSYFQQQDQASGLRRLFHSQQPRSISFIGGRGRIGKTSIVINIGAALAAQGKRVLLIDEFTGNGNINHRTGGNDQFEVADAFYGRQSIGQLISPIQENLYLLSLPLTTRDIAQLPFEQEKKLINEFEQIVQDIDFLLVDARPLSSPNQPSMALATNERVIVLADRAEAITDGYTFIKLLSSHFAKHDFLLLMSRVQDLDAARKLFARVAQVASRFTKAELRMLGFVPEDEWLHRANHMLHPILPAFPDADASQACLQLAEALIRLEPDQTQIAGSFMQRLIASYRAFLPSVLQ